MPDTVLKTRLSSLQVLRDGEKEPTHLLKAVYYDGCPLPPADEMMAPWSRPLTTSILSEPYIKPAEPGVYYRLPLVACEALGVAGPLAVIPFRIEIEHAPCTGYAVDEHGRGYQTDDKSDCRVHTTALWYGSYTVCGLLHIETAIGLAATPPHVWRQPRRLGVERAHPSYATMVEALDPGRVRLSHAGPLLARPVEVYRETA